MAETGKESRVKTASEVKTVKRDRKTEGTPSGDQEKPEIPDCCRHKSRERSEKEYKDLVNRLSRIEGQVRGIRKMLDDNAYCLDIIMQVTAINSALNSFNRAILTNHLETCVMDEVKDGKTDKMEELIGVLPKLMK